MQDQPIYKREYNRERQFACDRQIKFIETSLIPFVQMIQYYLEEAWYTLNLKVQYHFSWFYNEGISFDNLPHLKARLIDAAKNLIKYDKPIEEEGKISI